MTDGRTPQGFEDFWRQLRGPTRFTPDQLRSVSFRTHLKSLVAKAPVPVVSIVGATKSIGALRRHIDYISRDGEVALRTRDGETLERLDDMYERAEDWVRDRYESRPEPHRFAINAVLSMPPGTPREAVFAAGEGFARRYFATDWLCARHDDEPHPHLHLSLRAQNDDGRKLEFGPPDLHDMRGRFAEALRDHGVEAAASPRWARGVVERPLRPGVYRLEEDYLAGRAAEPRYVQDDIAEAREIARGRMTPPRPWEAQIKSTQQQVRDRYLQIADGLDRLGGRDDCLLAAQVRQFVTDMPEPLTRRERLVEDVRALEISRALARGRERDDLALER